MAYYQLRKNYFFRLKIQNDEIKAKLVIKTKETTWEHTRSKVIIPISIHSSFHEGLQGRMKMEAFISTIQQNVQSKTTILLTEMAHVNVLSLTDPNAVENCRKDALNITQQFQGCFQDSSIVFWEKYIQGDPNYTKYKKQVLEKYQKDKTFQKLLLKDAIDTYTISRSVEYPNKFLYLEKTIQDLLEQNVCLYILSQKGYKFQLYPGKPYRSIEYLNRDISMSLVYVFVAIEKKSAHQQVY